MDQKGSTRWHLLRAADQRASPATPSHAPHMPIFLCLWQGRWCLILISGPALRDRSQVDYLLVLAQIFL